MTAQIDAIVVDDEELGRSNLKALLDPLERWQVVAEAADGEAAIDLVAKHRPTALFLDIEMPVMSGMKVAKELLQQDCLPFTVFVTAYSQYAVQAFEVNAVDYLLKPLRKDRFLAAVARVEAALDQDQLESFTDRVASVIGRLSDDSGDIGRYQSRIAIRSVGRVQLIDVGEIAWIASAGNYVELHIEQRSVLHRQTLTSLIQQLDPDQFMRVHRSAAVNRDHVAELLNTATGSYSLRLRSGVEVPVSDRHRDDIKRQLGLKD
jgi:two-component system LytT family response regulator